MPADKVKYVFFGKIMPERVTLNISNSLPSYINLPEGNKIKVITDINNSQLISRIFLPKAGHPYHIESLRTKIQHSVEQFTDLLTYLSGQAYYLDIISVLKPNEETITFGASIPVNRDRSGQNLVERFDDIMNSLYTNKNTAQYLQLCMADLRASILIPRDTGSFCYRAIETLKNVIAEDSTEGSEAWKSFRDKIDISRETIEEVKGFADQRRHGEPETIDVDERAYVLRTTWEIVGVSLDHLLQEAYG